MNARHIIHLRAPWELRLDAPQPTHPQRVRLPIDLREHFPEHPTRTLILSRRFHPPRQLDPEEKLFCRLTEVPGLHSLRLNSQELLSNCTPLPSDSPTSHSWEIDLTPLLQPNNLLELTFHVTPDSSPNPQGLLGEVTLQIGTE